jgi:hypothetical protein
VIPESETTASSDQRITARLVEALAILQEHTNQVVRLADLSRTTWDQSRLWLVAAALLMGETLHQLSLQAGTEPPEPGTIIVRHPFELDVGDQIFPLGSAASGSRRTK